MSLLRHLIILSGGRVGQPRVQLLPFLVIASFFCEKGRRRTSYVPPASVRIASVSQIMAGRASFFHRRRPNMRPKYRSSTDVRPLFVQGLSVCVLNSTSHRTRVRFPLKTDANSNLEPDVRPFPAYCVLRPASYSCVLRPASDFP